MTIRVLLVDDQTLFREGLRTLLEKRPDLQVVGEAANGEEAVFQASRLRPDVVLMDLHMPVLGGAAATLRLRSAVPGCRVIALTTFDSDEDIFEALRAGAVAYLLKDSGAEEVIRAVHAAVRGKSVLEPSVAAKLVAEYARIAEGATARVQQLPEPLSERELEILRLLSRGATNAEIAGVLLLSVGTVKNHVTLILAKLEVRDRTQAALRARELELL